MYDHHYRVRIFCGISHVLQKKQQKKTKKQDISPSILSFKTMLQTYPIPRHVSVIQGMSIQDHLKDMWTNFHANTDADAQ